ncbi:hypothetical protein [Pseudomonas sp.]|uniref:hypothetical protein n=1 Tax=Pseudomonas sp. TaxID=306 RepID=UPI003FD88F23
MMLSELVTELKELLETQGDIEVVVASQDSGYESVKCTEFVYHDGASCLAID